MIVLGLGKKNSDNQIFVPEFVTVVALHSVEHLELGAVLDAVEGVLGLEVDDDLSRDIDCALSFHRDAFDHGVEQRGCYVHGVGGERQRRGHRLRGRVDLELGGAACDQHLRRIDVYGALLAARTAGALRRQRAARVQLRPA